MVKEIKLRAKPLVLGWKLLYRTVFLCCIENIVMGNDTGVSGVRLILVYILTLLQQIVLYKLQQSGYNA